MNKKYILNEIKRANKLVVLIFNFLYKLNEILTNLEIYLEGNLNNE